MRNLQESLERHQITIYFSAVLIAVVVAMVIPGTNALEQMINPALSIMLFATFLQVPIADLGRAFIQMRFLSTLLITNFVCIPLLVMVFFPFLPDEPMIRIGVLFVLLAPCIDYVVTFSHIGRADARLLLAATPVLLIVQMLLLPMYLQLFLGSTADNLVQIAPFLHAFIWMIVMPLIAALFVQLITHNSHKEVKKCSVLDLLPVPITAAVLFIIVAAVFPQLEKTLAVTIKVIPFYIAFAILAPMIGWYVARLFRLDAEAGRAVAFSASTRNSLVILPLALAIPGAIPVLPAVIVMQTMIELISELFYIRLMPKLGVHKNKKP